MGDHLIITISREFGSGGRKLGKQLADALNLPFYDRQVLKETNKLTDGGNKLPEELYQMQAFAIRQLGMEGPCVIVGRCAEYILRDFENCHAIFVHAKLEDRIKTVMERHGLNEKGARDMIDRIDKERANYHRYYTDMPWHDVRNYDISVNTSRQSIEASVAMLTKYFS